MALREAPGPVPAPRRADGPGLVMAGVDGTPGGWRAFAWACGQARRSGCPVLAVHVSGTRYWAPVVASGEAAATLLVETPVRVAEQLREETDRMARDFGVRARFQHRYGDPARELIAAARENTADLVVVGASAQPLHRIAGALPNRLARCRCVPLVVVP
ncbi:universal stress protein [Rhizomonospora bruguierae]|uniref:universal stress protein n=1 Tax=Rhizomonospora bruguierae TaxID=1581705 RepID=UPI001BCB79E6|nr:universal stress protein [Micromonospora sp. NBRC 107566]